MGQIKVNIEALDDKSRELKNTYQQYQTLKNAAGNIVYEGKGKTQDALAGINVSCDNLNEALNGMYVTINAFLECTRDGIVETEEYTKKLSEGIQ